MLVVIHNKSVSVTVVGAEPLDVVQKLYSTMTIADANGSEINCGDKAGPEHIDFKVVPTVPPPKRIYDNTAFAHRGMPRRKRGWR